MLTVRTSGNGLGSVGMYPIGQWCLSVASRQVARRGRWSPSTSPSTNGGSREYEAELAELQEQVEGPRGRGRRPPPPLQDAPKRVRTLEERLLETKGQLAQAVSPEREAHLHAARGARAHRRAARRGREAHPAAVGLRHVPRRQRRRHRRRLLRRPQDARRAAPRARRSTSSQRGQEVVLNESLNVVLARGTEVTGRGRHAQGAARRRHAGADRRPGRRGAGVPSWPTRCIGEKLRAGDTVLMDAALGPAAREAAPARGRGARARRGARHLLRRRRRPRRPDRADHRRGRAAVPPPRPVRRAPAAARRRASCSTARPAAARRSSPRRSPTRSPRRWPR